MGCTKEALGPEEHTMFWRADDLGDVELLHARYRSHSFGRHTHQSLALGVISGGVERFTCRGNGHHAVTGQIIVFNPEEAHTGEAADAGGWAFRMFYINAELLREAAPTSNGRLSDVPAFCNSVINDQSLADKLCRLHRTLESSDSLLGRQELFHMTLCEFTGRHANLQLEDEPVRPERRAVRLVREYLDAYTHRNVALNELAAISGLGSYHLIRVFRAETGLTPHAYFEQVRVHRARALLQRGASIADVAAALGFTDQSHLNRHFKRLTGVTPGVYRSAVLSRTTIFKGA